MRDYAVIEDHLRSDLGLFGKTEPTYLSDMSVQDAAKKAIADSFFKKLCPEENSKDADERALIKFKAINERLADSFEFSANNEAESCFWDYLKDNFNKTLGFTVASQSHFNHFTREYESSGLNFDLEFIRDHMAIGPGAAQKADSSTLATKLFSGPMSFTNSDYLITLYRSALAGTGLWADAEMHRFQKFGFSKVDGGKIFFAKKNAEISRTCCTEPNLNMLIQKALGDFCEMRLKHNFGISLAVQPSYNRNLARIGSIDGSFGTIDLVSASDSISWGLFNALMEDGFTKAVFSMARSEFAVLPDGEKVPLNMISTMGNGFTFPLQTIIFASAVRSVYQLMGFPSNCPQTQFGVFGDDIIVRREAYEFLIRMLHKLGFEVNEGKSFNNGPFRESCGEDYFSGVNIRGVFVRSLETPQEICSCINRLTSWSAQNRIRLPSLLILLRGMVPKAPFVPYSESDDAGIKVPFCKTCPKVSNEYWFKYRYYKRRSRHLVMPEPDDSPNPHGYGVSFLSGHSRRPDITNRTDGIPIYFGLSPVRIALREAPGVKGRYRVSSSAIPFWDWPGSTLDRDVQRHQVWQDMMLVLDFV